eukprot:1155342-Pelagomonas_calceolata.AAC.1
MGHCLKRSLKHKEQQKKPWPVHELSDQVEVSRSVHCVFLHAPPLPFPLPLSFSIPHLITAVPLTIAAAAAAAAADLTAYAKGAVAGFPLSHSSHA